MAVADDQARIDGSKAISLVVPVDEAARSLAVATSARPRALVVLHWLTVLVLLLAASVILARELVSAKPPRAWLLDIHRHLGLCVLLLFALRVALRLHWRRLPAVVWLAWPMRAAAVLMHAALYASILALPLLGWALSSAADKPVHFLGLALPSLVQPDLDLADQLLVWHQNAAWALLALATLHVAAALWHHFVLRDAVLRAMWPGRG
jgi:cytochrome b561